MAIPTSAFRGRSPEHPLRRPDVADAVEQFFEVIPTGRRLEAFIVHREALHDVLAQPLRSPNAKLRAAQRLDPVPDGNDDVEAVVTGVVLLAISGSYPEIPDN